MYQRSLVGLVLASMAATGCVTGGTKPEFEAARVVERMGDQTETPAWAHGDVALTSEGQDVVFIHFVSMSGNSRPEACLKAAELDGRTAFLRQVKDNITTSGQVNEQSAAEDPAYESLTAFLSQGNIVGARTAARYWERREESAESGERVLRIRCSVKVAIKRSELERQMRTAMGNGGNKEIREQLLKAQKEFLENAGAGAPAQEAH